MTGSFALLSPLHLLISAAATQSPEPRTALEGWGLGSEGTQPSKIQATLTYNSLQNVFNSHPLPNRGGKGSPSRLSDLPRVSQLGI